MNKLEKILEIKNKVAEHETKVVQDTAIFNNIMDEIQSVFSCKTVEEAKEKLQKERKQVTKTEAKLEESINEFVQKFGSQLGID